MLNTYELQCEYCQGTFQGKAVNQKTCSDSCRKALRRVNNTRHSTCTNCAKDFTYVEFSARPRKFCSHSCAASFNNQKTGRVAAKNNCKTCGSSISSTRTYCDECFRTPTGTRTQPTGLEGQCAIPSLRARSAVSLARYNNYITLWLSGQIPGGSDRKLSESAREYILASAGLKCESCGFNTPHPSDGKTILEVDHIDGDGSNHARANLRALCPNCHALTPTYRARNMGNGRKVYYLRVNKGE